MRLIAIFTFVFLCNKICLAQINSCATPKEISVCPQTTLLAESSNNGFNETRNYSVGGFGQSLSGKKYVYKITIPTGATKLHFRVKDLTANDGGFQYAGFVLLGNNCNPTGTTSVALSNLIPNFTSVFSILTAGYISSASKDFTLDVTGLSSPLYMIFDNSDSGTFNWDISFGATGTETINNTTNTMGNLEYDLSCNSTSTVNGNNVTWNGIKQTIPYSLTSGVAGQMCVTTYLQNTTGNAGPKRIVFHTGGNFSNISIPTPLIPGFYNSGSWQGQVIGDSVVYNFSDASGKGYGDFTGTPNKCLAYNLCFNLTPTFSSVDKNMIVEKIYSDLKGSPFIGTNTFGCCPGLNYSTCPTLGLSTSTIPTASKITLNAILNDIVSPINFVYFELVDNSELVWSINGKTKSTLFVVECSNDGVTFKESARIQSSNANIYQYNISKIPYKYFRIKAISNNSVFSNILRKTSKISEVNIYKNNSGEIIIDGSQLDNISIYNVLTQNVMNINTTEIEKETYLIQSNLLPKGAFVFKIEKTDETLYLKFIND